MSSWDEVAGSVEFAPPPRTPWLGGKLPIRATIRIHTPLILQLPTCLLGDVSCPSLAATMYVGSGLGVHSVDAPRILTRGRPRGRAQQPKGGQGRVRETRYVRAKTVPELPAV